MCIFLFDVEQSGFGANHSICSDVNDLNVSTDGHRSLDRVDQAILLHRPEHWSPSGVAPRSSLLPSLPASSGVHNAAAQRLKSITCASASYLDHAA